VPGGNRGGDGMLAALPLAAGFTLHLARALPIEFAYRENALGIVSRATLAQYPLQQETFWLLFAAFAGALFAWALARGLRTGQAPPQAQAGVEASGALGLVLALWLPGASGAAGCAAAAALAFALARRARAPGPGAVARKPPPPWTPRPAGALRVSAFVAAAAASAAFLNPPVWTSLWSVVNALPDERLVADTFLFHAESGQHLAWADAILRGELHGRDFFCLYGPLYDIGLAAFWQLTGRSIAAWKLYFSGGNAVGYAAALLLAGVLLRRKGFALLFPFFVLWVTLRIGLALAALACLVAWRKSGRARWLPAAGAICGVSLLYSQEFGLAQLLTSLLAFAALREARAGALFVAGFAAVVAPVLGWFAYEGALEAMLRDVAAYPGYMVAGYGKLPFPSLLDWLPFRLATFLEPGSLDARVGHAAPAVYAAALLLGLRVGSLEARRPLAWLRAAVSSLSGDPFRFGVVATAVFGALSFRSALGRSDITHIMNAVVPAAVLMVVAVDRIAADWRAERARRGLAATRAAALLLFALHAGAQDTGMPLRLIGYSASDIGTLARTGYSPPGSPHVMQVARWILDNTETGEPVLFMPNDAGYYYLTQRRSPIRFVLGHQMVTQAHRAEALAALRARPPRFVVWDHGVLEVDDIGYRDVFGRPFLAWIERNYTEAARMGRTRILRWRGPPPPPPPR
jgi:hypothetical protein